MTDIEYSGSVAASERAFDSSGARARHSSRRRRVAVAVGTAAVLATGVCVSSQAQAAAAGWAQQSVPGGAGNILAVTSVVPNTLWAAGFTMNDAGGGVSFSPLVLSRDASLGAWTAVPTPALSGSSRANAISAAGPDDVWLTGDSTGAPGAKSVVTEHWDGSAWSVVDAPLPSTGTDGDLLGVATLGPDDAWAVGSDQSGPNLDALIERWDGVSWQVTALPSSSSDGVVLNAVTALGPHDLWVGGVDYNDDEPVLLHGDGTSWQQVPIPGAGVSGAYTRFGEVDALTSDGSGGIYLVGAVYASGSDPGHALVEHWDGKQWQTNLPEPSGNAILLGATLTPDGLAVVGYDPSHTEVSPYDEILQGRSWRPLNVPDIGSAGTQLDAVISTRQGLVAVGGYNVANDENTYPIVFQQQRGR